MLTISNTVSLLTSLNEHDMPDAVDCDQVVPEDSKCIQLAVHTLMCYRQHSESPDFAKRAIESLVKKIKDRLNDLDALVTVISTGGVHPSKCVTIQRTLDGRMQIAGRKCLPHVMYARIWRWPNIHRNELKHLSFCSFGFNLKRDSICVNPYHYERIEPNASFSSLNMSPYDLIADACESESEHSETSDHVSSTTHNASFLSSQRSSNFSHEATADSTSYLIGVQKHSDIANTSLTSQANSQPVINKSSKLKSSAAQHLPTDSVNPPPHLDRGQNTMAWSGIALLQPSASMPFSSPDESVNKNQLASCTNDTTSHSAGSTHSVIDPNQLDALKINMCAGGEETGNGGTPNSGGGGGANNSGRNALSYNTASGASGGGSGDGSGAGWGQRSGAGGSGPPQSPFTPSGSLLQPVPMLTSQRPPEFWCNIAYFELDQQVGELFKVPSQYSRVTVDGYTDPSSPNRFCLGQLSNVHRSEQSEKSRLYIGKGVELDNVGEGDVWIRCLSEFSVFVQSYYLDREAGRRPGDAVHKIYPGAYIKVFDIRQCHEQMKLLAHSAQIAAEHQAAVVVGSLPSPTATSPQIPQLILQLPPGPSQTAHNNQTSLPGAAAISPLATVDVGVDDLRRLCMLRLSFVKGWGPDYPRRSIKETPCWIEIQLHRPLQLLDEVLQGMPLNDRKPTRHFFPYFSQQATGCAAPRPHQAATRRS